MVHAALYGPREQLDEFLVSNTLWGGMGSIADQCVYPDNQPLPPAQKSRIHRAMVNLGEAQIQLGLVNQKTEMWTSAFKMQLPPGPDARLVVAEWAQGRNLRLQENNAYSMPAAAMILRWLELAHDAIIDDRSWESSGYGNNRAFTDLCEQIIHTFTYDSAC